MDVVCAHEAIQIANIEIDAVRTNAENEFKNPVQREKNPNAVEEPLSCGSR